MSGGGPGSWQRVPILMYHRVAEDEAAAARDFFSISRQRFAAQLRCLRRLGYRAVPLDEVLDWLGGTGARPRRSVAITFDDGYADTYHVAAPLLERYGYRATVFLVAGRVGQASDWDPQPQGNGSPLMGWPEARDLARRGFALGSHTLTHHAPRAG